MPVVDLQPGSTAVTTFTAAWPPPRAVVRAGDIGAAG